MAVVQLSPHLVDRRQRMPSNASECKPNSLLVKNDAMRDQRTQSVVNNRPPAIVQRRTKLPSAADGLLCVISGWVVWIMGCNCYRCAAGLATAQFKIFRFSDISQWVRCLLVSQPGTNSLSRNAVVNPVKGTSWKVSFSKYILWKCNTAKPIDQDTWKYRYLYNPLSYSPKWCLM